MHQFRGEVLHAGPNLQGAGCCLQGRESGMEGAQHLAGSGPTDLAVKPQLGEGGLVMPT